MIKSKYYVFQMISFFNGLKTYKQVVPRCAIDNTHLAWGRHEYLYQVLKNHPTNTIPEEGMVMVRYHSFYSWHTGGSYAEIVNEKDEQYKEWIKDFNKYGLYTKCDKNFDFEEIKSHYQPIAQKYLGMG